MPPGTETKGRSTPLNPSMPPTKYSLVFNLPVFVSRHVYSRQHNYPLLACCEAQQLQDFMIWQRIEQLTVRRRGRKVQTRFSIQSVIITEIADARLLAAP